MTNDQLKITAGIAILAAIYLYVDGQNILKACAKANVTGLEPKIQARVDKKKK